MTADTESSSERRWSPELRATILAHAKDGFSRAEIAAAIGRSLGDFDDWDANEPQFREAMEMARTLTLAWWEGRGREGIRDGKLNATLWSKAMAGRFPDLYGERAAAAGARSAAGTLKRTRPITDRDRAKALALLMALHPAEFEAANTPPTDAVAAPGSTDDGSPRHERPAP
jgi:hypothetical protein